jgi:hypothetical protein
VLHVRQWISDICGIKSFLYSLLKTLLNTLHSPGRCKRFPSTSQCSDRLWSPQWTLGALSPGLKRPKLEADQSPPSSAQVKNCEAIPPNTSSWRGSELINYRDLTFTNFAFFSFFFHPPLHSSVLFLFLAFVLSFLFYFSLCFLLPSFHTR